VWHVAGAKVRRGGATARCRRRQQRTTVLRVIRCAGRVVAARLSPRAVSRLSSSRRQAWRRPCVLLRRLPKVAPGFMPRVACLTRVMRGESPRVRSRVKYSVVRGYERAVARAETMERRQAREGIGGMRRGRSGCSAAPSSPQPVQRALSTVTLPHAAGRPCGVANGGATARDEGHVRRQPRASGTRVRGERAKSAPGLAGCRWQEAGG